MNQKYKQDFIKAGALAGQVRAFGKLLIKKGASYNDVITQINAEITELGATPAFPPQIALNHVAAHFLPNPDQDIIFNDEVIKLDVGICYQGAIGDCAVTIDLSGKYQPLINAAEAALLAAEKSIHVGQKVSEIGKIIEDTILFHGFTPVKNLCGHGLGSYKVHMPPSIPNYNDRSTATLKAGMTFAIEPFATDGRGYIYDAGSPTIFSYKANRSPKSQLAKLLLTKIKTFLGLPFSIHQLVSREHPYLIVKPAVDELLKLGVIDGYAPLVEEAHGMVAQAENSILIDDEGKVHVTTRLP